jgi:outer membrane protein assembly factor BamD (BamD/ComL family)
MDGMKTVFWMAVFCFLLFACASDRNVISGDLTPAELVQMAQEESDKNSYGKAARFYNMILERFPDDRAAVCGARYEIAFINYKQKKYDEAEQDFNALLELYDGSDGDLLPQKYYILSSIVLENINTARQKQRKVKATAEE